MKKRAPVIKKVGPSCARDGLTIDLASLRAMHPRLPGDVASVMVLRAALGFQRNKHAPGVDLQMLIEGSSLSSVLTWPGADLASAKQHDDNRITEDGAEAVALAVGHETKAWSIVRRLQREECADWLLEHRQQGTRKLVALEVSGVARGTITARLQEKLDQVSRSKDVDHRWAGVVGFQQPEMALQPVED